ncbi:hypothetical protein D9M71_730300 [compost metagenome]
MGAGLGHIAERATVLGDGRQLLIDLGGVSGLLNQGAGGLKAGFELAQQVVDDARALFAATHFVVQARDAQIFGQPIDLGNETQFIAATDHVAQAGPAGEGDQQGQ